ncbi:hypothetical protein GCM10009630_03900 [Kribbella jejuensis]|uniref:Uncharacterized protein n=1 Tax=Kribbella jejuensis TaxID=236068 RepID=A0A542EU59_9ACTN|nr:hypothetical protein [Kribbella jejuensis]TQJ18903.1 hypothetical protein FB475_3057 [Kribbella jejuensis]
MELVRRPYTHLLLPHAALDDPQRALFQVALRPAGWVTDPAENSTMALRWTRGHAALRLQTLGWFPLLVTVGPIGKPSPVHRDAAARLTAAVLAGGGRSFSDKQLVEYLPQAQLRWQRALLERQRLSTAERMLQARRCSYCGAWSDPPATHCAGCRRRFTAADDAEREATVDRATATIDEAETTLAELARGVVLERLGGGSGG